MGKEVKDLFEYFNPISIRKDYFIDNSIHRLNQLLDNEYKKYITYEKVKSIEELNMLLKRIEDLLIGLEQISFREKDAHMLDYIFAHFIFKIYQLKFMLKALDNMLLDVIDNFYSDCIQQKVKDLMIRLKDITNKDYTK